MKVQSKPNGKKFNVSLSFTSAIRIPKPGKHRLTFYTSFSCNNIKCKDAGLVVSALLKDGSQEDHQFEEIGRAAIRELDFKWTEEAFSFTSHEDEVYVNISIYL